MDRPFSKGIITSGGKYWLFPILIIALAACNSAERGISVNQEISGFESKMDYSIFIDPPSKYRSFPFYALNNTLVPNDITEQIKGFREAGLGGFYLHGRTGLLTEYMGKDWWEVMDAAVDAANESGLHAWFYDEYNWPSGYAGGIIPRMDPIYRAKCLARLDLETTAPPGSKVLSEDGDYRYIEYTMQLGEPKFYESSYVDLLNPEVVREFINTSYLPYVQRYKDKSGSSSFGIFTDEPHIHSRYFDRNTPNAGVLTWSPFVAEKFQELCGMDLLDYLPLLFEERDNWREIRLYYYRAVALQFEESFSRQISEFCGQNGIVFTGHYLGEDVLQKVRDRIGNSMLHYRNMQQPGMDHLGLTITDRLITARSLSSVANQYDKPRRLSEIFGISGQNMNFEDRKWIAGWHAVLGINHFCQHQTLYSIAGERKRDYPPTFSYHQPYWSHNKSMEDYLGRLSYAATIGRYNPQFLVLNPLESEYLKGSKDGEFTSPLLVLMQALQGAHYDYDLGDEQILSDTAFIVGSKLQVGAMEYSHVILPDMISIRKSSIELLLALEEGGGKLFNSGRFPLYVDGKEDQQILKKLRERVTDIDRASLSKDLGMHVMPNVILEGENSEKIWSHFRRYEHGELILLYNTSHTETIRFRMHRNSPEEQWLLWDPSREGCYPLPEAGEEGYMIEIPSSSLVWLTHDNDKESMPEDGFYGLPEKDKTLMTLNGKWKGRRLDPNAITLDFARYSTDGGRSFSDPEPVIGIRNRFSDGLFSGPLILHYPVHITDVPENCQLVVENNNMYQNIRVNGHPVEFSQENYYIDKHFYSADVGGFLGVGLNEIELSLDFIYAVPGSEQQDKRYGTEIESIYLTGDFAVSGLSGESTMNSQRNETGDFIPRPVHGFRSFTLTSEAETFSGNLTLEGYPFYAGEFELSTRFHLDSILADRQYFIELPNTEAIVSIIEINGQVVDSLYWAPFKTSITRALHSGENEVKITMVNSLRNLLGPHHQPKAELTRVGPNSFTGLGGFPDPGGDKDWYELRKKGEDLRLWTDTYYNIPFGFLEPVKITISD